MDTSSEGSFIWTDTNTSDSEVTCHQKAMKYEEESDFDKNFKKKLQKELFQNGYHDEPPPETPRERKKKHKRERAASPPPIKRESPAIDADVEARLRLRVKRERARTAEPEEPRDSRRSDDEPPPKKKKKKKHKRETLEVDDVPVDEFQSEDTIVETRAANIRERITFEEDSADRPDLEPAPEPEAEPRDGRCSDTDEPPPKKKKKKKKHKREPEVDGALVDEFKAEDTVVETRATVPPSPPARAANVRERITFEEDSTDRPSPAPEPEPEPKAGAGGRLARYVRAHAGLRPAAAGGARVGAGDDVWLLRAPRSLPPAALAGVALAPEARARVRVAGRAYDAAPAPAARAALVLAGAGAAWRVRGLRLRGALELRARVPRPRAPSAERASSPPPAAPPPTRARHPLLGADYERAPRARAPDRGPLEEKPARKKKKKKKYRPQEPEEPEEPPAEPALGRWDSERAIERSLFGV